MKKLVLIAIAMLMVMTLAAQGSTESQKVYEMNAGTSIASGTLKSEPNELP